MTTPQRYSLAGIDLRALCVSNKDVIEQYKVFVAKRDKLEAQIAAELKEQIAHWLNTNQIISTSSGTRKFVIVGLDHGGSYNYRFNIVDTFGQCSRLEVDKEWMSKFFPSFEDMLTELAARYQINSLSFNYYVGK